MIRRAASLVAVSAALLLVDAAAARAQGTAVTGAMIVGADILYAPLSGTGVRPLSFGMIVPGTGAVVIAPNSALGGEWRLTGTVNRKSIDISFTLPASLTGPGGATIPLNFNGNTAALCEIDPTGTCVAASYLAWDPVAAPTFRDTPQRYKPGRPKYTYDMYSVYMGGTATPAAGQRAGRYTATIGVQLVIN